MKNLLKFIIVIAVLAAIAFGVKSYFFDGATANQVGSLISTPVVTDTTYIRRSGLIVSTTNSIFGIVIARNLIRSHRTLRIQAQNNIIKSGCRKFFVRKCAIFKKYIFYLFPINSRFSDFYSQRTS